MSGNTPTIRAMFAGGVEWSGTPAEWPSCPDLPLLLGFVFLRQPYRFTLGSIDKVGLKVEGDVLSIVQYEDVGVYITSTPPDCQAGCSISYTPSVIDMRDKAHRNTINIATLEEAYELIKRSEIGEGYVWRHGLLLPDKDWAEIESQVMDWRHPAEGS